MNSAVARRHSPLDSSSRLPLAVLSWPETIHTVNNLANVLADSGSADEAEPLFKRALEGKERGLGPRDPPLAPAGDAEGRAMFPPPGVYEFCPSLRLLPD